MADIDRALKVLEEAVAWGRAHSAEVVQGSRLDVESLEAFLKDYERLRGIVAVMNEETVLTLWLHDRYSITVRGNLSALSRLRDLVIPDTLVKGYMMVRQGKKIESMNYTQIKARREELGGRRG